MSIFTLKASKVPAFNEPLMSPGVSGLTTHPSDYRELDHWITRTPELIRVIASVQEDILGEGIFFVGPESGVKRAEAFWEDNFVKEELKKAIFDWLLYGDGYLWKGQFSEGELQKVRAKALSKMPAGFNVVLKAKDEDSINFIRHVPSSTMNIHLNDDKTAIEDFEQIISGEAVRDKKWSPSEIVHAKYWTVKGKVYGFSPAMALIVELQAIGYIKDYATSFFKQGGWPDWLFSFPNEPANSPRINAMIAQLQKYKHPVHKHGNLVIGGEMKAERLNEFSKDMEFRQLLIQFAGIIAHAYGLPAGRISSIIGAEVRVSTGSDDLANEAYWSMIRNHKDYWETILNSQVFSKFGKVKVQFPHAHKVDEVRETMSKIQTVDYISSLQSLGVQINMQFIQDKLSLKNEWLKSQTLLPPMQNPHSRQMMQGIKEAGKDTAGQGQSAKKRKEQQTNSSDKQKLGM